MSALFEFSRVVDSAMKIVDKISGTDITPKEWLELLIKYQDSTKHQSASRRFIALSATFAWLLMLTLFVVAIVLKYFFGVDGAEVFATEIHDFMKETIVEPYNLIISFYFAVSAIVGLKK